MGVLHRAFSNTTLVGGMNVLSFSNSRARRCMRALPRRRRSRSTSGGHEQSRCGQVRSGQWQTQAAALRLSGRPNGDEHPAKRPSRTAGVKADRGRDSRRWSAVPIPRGGVGARGRDYVAGTLGSASSILCAALSPKRWGRSTFTDDGTQRAFGFHNALPHDLGARQEPRGVRARALPRHSADMPTKAPITPPGRGQFRPGLSVPRSMAGSRSLIAQRAKPRAVTFIRSPARGQYARMGSDDIVLSPHAPSVCPAISAACCATETGLNIQRRVHTRTLQLTSGLPKLSWAIS